MADSELYDSIVIGAGLAGLACAIKLEAQGFNVCLLEASGGVGGRVASDELDGFILDRGFQVFLTAYPEAAKMLDYKSLDLRPFFSGALIYENGRFQRLADPFKQPASLLPMMLSDVVSLSDKLKIAYLRQKVMASSINDIFSQGDTTIKQHLKNLGFSDDIISRFFSPFFGGITLDRELSGSSRMFEFIYKMMAEGQVTVPAAGMGAITAQLAARLKPDTLKLNSRVQSVDQHVNLSDRRLQARSIVVATEGPEAARLLPRIRAPRSLRATCLYFAAPQAPMSEPILVLNAGGGLINNLAVMSNTASTYAPDGQSLISVTVLGEPELEGERLTEQVLAELKAWYGKAADEFRHLRTYVIHHAQPAARLGQAPQSARLTGPDGAANIYVCGDHYENASINGALVSGRKAAEAVLADLKIAVG